MDRGGQERLPNLVNGRFLPFEQKHAMARMATKVAAVDPAGPAPTTIKSKSSVLSHPCGIVASKSRKSMSPGQNPASTYLLFHTV